MIPVFEQTNPIEKFTGSSPFSRFHSLRQCRTNTQTRDPKIWGHKQCSLLLIIVVVVVVVSFEGLKHANNRLIFEDFLHPRRRRCGPQTRATTAWH